MRNTQSISITVPNDLMEALNKLQKEEMKNCSAIVSEAVKEYCARKTHEKLVKSFSQAGKEAGIITEEDIDKAVHEVKRNARKKAGN